MLARAFGKTAKFQQRKCHSAVADTVWDTLLAAAALRDEMTWSGFALEGAMICRLPAWFINPDTTQMVSGRLRHRKTLHAGAMTLQAT